jgi:hypothetical protein
MTIVKQGVTHSPSFVILCGNPFAAREDSVRPMWRRHSCLPQRDSSRCPVDRTRMQLSDSPRPWSKLLRPCRGWPLIRAHFRRAHALGYSLVRPPGLPGDCVRTITEPRAQPVGSELHSRSLCGSLGFRPARCGAHHGLSAPLGLAASMPCWVFGPCRESARRFDHCRH